MCRPSGRNCAENALSIFNGVSGPPVARTRVNEPTKLGKTMSSWALHDAPENVVDTSWAMVCARPVEMRTFFKLFAAKNAIHSLSGDQNGVLAPSVPGRSLCSPDVRD